MNKVAPPSYGQEPGEANHLSTAGTESQRAAWRALWQRLLSKSQEEPIQQSQTAVTTESDLVDGYNQQSSGRGNESR
jgi:hypothetical protein